jgi:hypothetical protein
MAMKEKVPPWLTEAWENVAIVSKAVWYAIPQRARDHLVGALFGAAIAGAFVAAKLWR